MNKWIKYIIIAVIIFFLGYNAIYIERLSDRVSHKDSDMDVVAMVKDVWEKKLPSKIKTAMDIDSLKNLIATDPKTAFSHYTHSLALGNYKYALVKGHASVKEVNKDDITIQVEGSVPFAASLETEFLYGNTLRDALGIFDLKDFPNTEDLNKVSKQLNEIVKKEVVPILKSKLKVGDQFNFVGAIQLNEAHIHFEGLEIVPLSIKIVE